MWHASAAPFGVTPIESVLRDCALAALEGVGDPALGEWGDWTGRAFHVRRRLTDEECAGLAVLDVRGTEEAWFRFTAVRRFLPASQLPMAMAEVHGE